MPVGRRTALGEAALVVSLAIVASVVMTYPLAFKLGHVGRTETADGWWSVWVITWVARTLVADPRHLFDANIFFPHANTLAFSEYNLGGGLLGVPAYWLTRNPHATHNFVVLAGFVLSAVGMYYLCRRLTGSRGAAAVGAVTFAFCPYVFGRTAHIQLLLVCGLPLVLLAFHRLVDRPTTGRAVVLSVALVLQAATCGYYGVFAGLVVALGVLAFAGADRRWRHLTYWRAVSVAALLTSGLGALLYLPYARLHAETGFVRTLGEAQQYSADWRAYFASNAHAHRWMLAWLGSWKEVLFPGFVATALGLGAIAWSVKRASRHRGTVTFYGVVGALALWASLGPDAGLYTVLYTTIPVFSLTRAPSRFGVLVALSLSVLAAFAVSRLMEGRRHPGWTAAALACAAFVELGVWPIDWREVPPLPSPYRMLAALPAGPVVEFPFFDQRQDFPRHSVYMVNATYHWQPLVNGYSDYIPPDFREMAPQLGGFPSADGFNALRPKAPRYAVFRRQGYSDANWAEVQQKVQGFAPYLRLVVRADDVWVYEIVGWPP